MPPKADGTPWYPVIAQRSAVSYLSNRINELFAKVDHILSQRAKQKRYGANIVPGSAKNPPRRKFVGSETIESKADPLLSDFSMAEASIVTAMSPKFFACRFLCVPSENFAPAGASRGWKILQPLVVLISIILRGLVIYK